MFNHIKNLYKGRLGRFDYFFSFVIPILIVFIPMSIAGALRSSELFPLAEIFEIFSFIYLFTIPFTVVSAVIRRGHDIGWSGGFSISMFLIGQIIIIPNLLLLFQKGDMIENKYGSKKQGNFFQRFFNLN